MMRCKSAIHVGSANELIMLCTFVLSNFVVLCISWYAHPGGMVMNCFKAYDIRGKVDADIDVTIAYRIGRAMAVFLTARTIVVGADCRLSSPAFKKAVIEGICDAGCDVYDIGQTGTEEVYFAVNQLKADGGIQITASHNPIDYNGMKCVREGAKPMSADSGLRDIEQLVVENSWQPALKGQVQELSTRTAYIDHLMGYIKPQLCRPMKIVVNAGHGMAGAVLDDIADRLSESGLDITFIRIQHEPDGSYPCGVPNPMLAESREATSKAVQSFGADLGISWDGDFDRCFFFDHEGNFVNSYYIVGLFAKHFLKAHPKATIVHDPRLVWHTQDCVKKAGGQVVACRSGHSFIKDCMRKHEAVYGGEISAHHYFKDFFYCDSGMIPWLVLLMILNEKDSSLAGLIAESKQRYPCSDEINLTLRADKKLFDAIRHIYQDQASEVDSIDGLSVVFSDWRFNLRASQTEPLVRLNIEARSEDVLDQKIIDLKSKVLSFTNEKAKI